MKDKMLTPSYIQRKQEIMRELDEMREEVMANEHPTAERLTDIREKFIDQIPMTYPEGYHLACCDLWDEIDALRAELATAVDALKFYDVCACGLWYERTKSHLGQCKGKAARAALEKLGVTDAHGRK